MIEMVSDIRRITPLLNIEDRWQFAGILALMLLASVLEAIGIGAVPAFVTLLTRPSALANAHFFGELFQDMPDQVNLQIVIWASLVLLGFIVLKNLFLVLAYRTQARVVANQRLKLGDRLFRLYQSAPFEWYLQRSSADMLHRIQNDSAQVLGGYVLPLLSFVQAAIMGGVVVLVLLSAASGLTLLALLFTGAGFLLISRALRQRLRESGHTTWLETQAQIKAIQQGFGSLADARILGSEEAIRSQHAESLKRLCAAQCHQQTVQRATPQVLETLAVVGLLTILYLLLARAGSPAEVLPQIALLGVVMVRLKQLSAQVTAATNQMNIGRAFIPAIVEDLATLEGFEEQRDARQSRDPLIAKFQRLTLEHVYYTYPRTGKPVLHDISFSLRSGESVALVGPTGCGKSTLLYVILGLLEPTKGRIQVNDVELARDESGWHRLLGYVSQSVFLVDDTVRANVAFGIPPEDADDGRVWRCLEAACLAKFVRSLADGLDATVGERGVRISGGQRQRLGIARALYRNPDVLVLDEATSSLDSRTEEEVMRNIKRERASRTLIVVAHRLSTVEDCDRLYFLQDGRIAGTGRFAELLSQSPEFRRMTALPGV